MKSILKSSKIVIMSIVMAVVVAVGGTVTAVNLLGEKEETPNGGLNGAGFESQVANAEGVTYDDYLDVTNRGGGDGTKTIITFDKYLENINNAGSESDSDTELLKEENRTDDQFKINCDYLTGADSERVLGIDGVLGSDEVGISPSEKQIVVDKEFNSTDKSKSVRFEVEPEKGVDFNTEIANIYYISKIAIVVSQNGEDKTLDIAGGYSEGVISYDSIKASRYERTSYEYNLVVNLATFAIKFEVDDLTGKLSFEITSTSEWQADSINLEFTIKLRDKKQNNKALIEKDGSSYNLTNSSGVFSLTETDKGLFYGKEFNNPHDKNTYNEYTVDDKLTYYLTNDSDVRNYKILKQAEVGNIENEELHNWFTIYGGVYANGYFFFSGTVKDILVENGILEAEVKSFSNKETYTYYKLKNPNTGDFSDRIVYKDSTSCILINKSNQCVYIKYDSAFLLKNGAQNVVLNKYSEKSDYLEFTIDATNKNTYQKFELDFYDNGKIILNQWGAEQSMSVAFSEQYYYLVEFSKKIDGVRLSAEPFDVAKVFVTANGSRVDFVEFERTIADRPSGERNETFKTLFAGVGENAFTIESSIKLGVNYEFDLSVIDSSKVKESEETIGGETKNLKIIYEEGGVQTNKRSFIASLSTENIKSITVNIQLLYDKNLSVGTPEYKQFEVEGTTVSIGANTATGTWGSLIVGDKLGSDSQFEDQTNYLKQFYLEDEVLFLKICFGIKLSSGFRIDGGKYWYKDKGESSATEFNCSGYSISETDLEELFAGFVTEKNIVTEDYSNICINFYVKPIEISQPLYVAYDSSIYENTIGFTEIDTLENALKFNIENGIISQMKVGKSGSELYKLVGHIRISSDIVEVSSVQTATTVVYFKPLGESEFKKLNINNLPTKDGYAFLGIYSSIDGLSDGAYSGIGHMGNTDHNGLVDRNIIESSGVNMRYDASNNPQCYELMIGGQYFSYEEWQRQCEVFGRDEAQWETIFSKYFQVATERSEGAYYANKLGEVCCYAGGNIDETDWGEYKYTLSLSTITKIYNPTKYTYLENVVYFDKNGLSSTYEETKCDDKWRTRYCYKLVESYYSYNVTDNSNQYELRLLDGGKYKFFTYSEVRGKSLESKWTEVFLNNFKDITDHNKDYEGSGVFYYNTTGGISETYSPEYCYILKNENGSNEVYSGYQIDKNLVYLNKLSYYNDSLEGSYLVFYAMFDSICNEKEIEFKDYNFTGDDSVTKIHILGEGYIYTDTDFLVLEKLVGERRFLTDGTSGVATTIHSSAISARLTYNATEYPIMSSDFALELYPISNPEYLSKNQRIAYFTTDEAHFLDNTKTNNGDTYYISDDEFKVDRKRVDGKAVYHLASLYKEENGKTSWYVVPTELEFEFDIVSVDAEHFVKDDSGTFTKYNDYGSYTTRTYDKIKYGYSLLDLLSFANDSVPALSDIVKTSTLKYLLNGGSQGIFDNSISVITGETLRGYNLYGFIPFTVEYDDSGMDLAVEFNFELLKNYFGWESSDLESRRNEYLNLINNAGADYKRQFVLESVEKLDKTNYFALVTRVSEKCGTNIDSLSTEQIIDAFLNQETLMGLKYVVTIEGGNQEVDAYEYNLQLVTDAIDRQVSLDILKSTPFVALDKFAGSIYESGNITTFIKDSGGNIMMVNPEDGNEVIDASFVFYRNIVFIPVFVSKNANIEIDANGKILLDGNYLFVDEGKSEYSKVDGVFGEITKEVDPVDPDETDAPDDPEKVDINKFTATTNGILLEDEGSPDSSFTTNTSSFKDLLLTSVRVNKRISSVDLSKFALTPTIPSGYYISGVNAIVSVGRISQSIRLINYSLEKDGVNRKFTYSSNLNEEYFSQFFNGGVGTDYYKIKEAEKTEEVNTLFSGILYVGENGVVYWDVFDDCKLEFVYSPFKYQTSFKTSEAVEKEFEKNNDAGALDISNVSMTITSNKSYDFLNSTIAGFLGETATIYSGGNLYVFNTITLKQLAVKDSTKLGEGKYLSNGVFVATIKVRYNTIFDEPKTEPHILGVEFVIKTDTKGIPYIVSKKIVDISYEDYNYVTDEMVDITEDIVGEALFEALDYNFATDEFIFSMEALANADNVISSVEFEFELDYKTYVLSFSAGLYKSESFSTAGKIEPKDPESITDFSTVYYLVKYNDRKWINMWIPCNKEGEPIGDAFDLNKPEMVISGSVYAFDMAESVKRFLEVTTMYDGKPRYFSFWVRDVRGVGIPAVGGGELTFEELEICHRIPDAETGEYKKDSEGHILWYIDNVFDSESGGSFDYYTLFVDEADINVHYYTWNSLKSTNSTNGYTITAHKGYFFGAEPESKDFFTVNAFEYYTFGGNSDERYYIVGWLKVYDNILTVLGADGETYELSEFKYSYFNNRTENGIIVDYRTKDLLGSLDNPYVVADSDTSGFLYGLNQQITVKKRDVVDLGVINIYMFAVYARVTYNVESTTIDGKQQYNAEILVPNTPEMGNLEDGVVKNTYQFINYPNTNNGNASATSNVVSYWAKYTSADYEKLIGLYFDIKDMLNSGVLKFTVLTDGEGKPIKNSILPDVVNFLAVGDVLVNFYCRTEDIRIITNGIEIDGLTSEIISGAKRVGTKTEDGFQFDKYVMDAQLTKDGTFIGIFDNVIILDDTETDSYAKNYVQALAKLQSLKTADTMGEYRLRELLARTSLQLAQWASDESHTNKFTFDKDAEDLTFDFSNATDAKLQAEYKKLIDIINFITKGTEYNGSTEIKLNSASFVRLCYAITSYNLIKSSYSEEQFESLEISKIVIDMGLVFGIDDNGTTIYFTGDNTDVLSGGIYLDRVNYKPDAGDDYYDKCNDFYMVGDIIKFEYSVVLGVKEQINADGSIDIVEIKQTEIYYGIYLGSHQVENGDGSISNPAYVVSANSSRGFNVGVCTLVNMNHDSEDYIVIKQNTMGDKFENTFSATGRTYIRVF